MKVFETILNLRNSIPTLCCYDFADLDSIAIYDICIKTPDIKSIKRKYQNKQEIY